MAWSVSEIVAALTTTTALVMAVGLVAFIVASSRVVQRRSEARHPPRGEFVEVDGVRVHLVREGEGAPVLLLHGLNGFIQDWYGPLLDDLARDHQVLAIDRPGYGHSTRPRRDLSDPRVQADWLVELLDALGIERPLVVGHSWGGGLAMTLAHRHPARVAGLVLVAPYVYPGTEPDDLFHRFPRLPFLRNVVAHMFLVPVGRLIGRLFVHASFDPEPVPEGYLDMWHAISLRKDHFDTTLEEIRTIDPALHRVAPHYGAVGVPIAIVAGDGDRSVDPERNARRLSEAIEGSRLVWLEGVGHMVPYTRPAVILEAVRAVAKEAAAQEAAGTGSQQG